MARRRNLLETFSQDVRFALRTLAKNPGFTAIVVLTLALGIGANTAIFGLADQVMLRVLPVEAPGRLVVLDTPGVWSGHTSNNSVTLTPLSHPMFEGLRDRATPFLGVFAHRAADVDLAAGGRAESANAELVSGAFFDVLGLRPAHGRLLRPDDDRPGAPPVAVLSHRAFLSRFGGDAGIVGRSVHVNGQPTTIVGVAPAGFDGVEVGDPVDVFVPLALQPQVLPVTTPLLGNWRTRWLTVIARLRDGETLASAETAANVAYAQLNAEDLAHVTTAQPERFRNDFLAKRLQLLPAARGTSNLRDQARTPLLVLLGMVGLVLLIACANVANLLMARGSARHKEMAVRLALGAGRGRLVRQLVVESLLLSLGGGALGLALSVWAGQGLIATLPVERGTLTLHAEPDLRIALFAFVVSLATGLLFGLWPAFAATRLAVATTLKNEATSVVGGAGRFRFRRGLVVAQIALSLLLLVGAGLFARSLGNLRALDPGFEPERLVAFGVDAGLAGYPPERRLALFDRLRADLAREPGVRQVTLADTPLMTHSDNSSTVMVEGYAGREDEDMNPNFNRVGPGFFATMGTPILRGRDIAETDRPGGPKVAVVNETFAKYYFGDRDPIGRRFGRKRDNAYDTEIVGVVRDGRSASLRETPPRFVYLAQAQNPGPGEITFYARTAGDTAALSARVPGLVQAADPELPVRHLTTMRAQIRDSLYVERLVAGLSTAFGALATMLAALGLYGVMSCAVALRTREIGIRMALGAARRDVLRMVLRDVSMLVALGVALGLPGGYGLGRLVESELFGLHARDPLTFGVATATLLLAALAAGLVPARRAAGLDPLVALRSE